MSDRDDRLRGIDWGQVNARIVAYAMKRTRSKARASDLAQESMLRVLDAKWNAWDPEKDPDIVTYLIKIVNRLITNDHQKQKVHREIAMDRELRGETASTDGEDLAAKAMRRLLGGDADGESGKAGRNPIAHAGPTPEAEVANRELYRRRLARLREVFARDKIVLDVLDQTEQENDSPDEQATATGHELHEIHTARRRLHFQAKKVAREIPALPGDEAASDEEA